MADGRWTMTEDELNHVVSGFDAKDAGPLPNQGLRKAVDDREGQAAKCCAFCGSERLTTGLGGCGEGFSYRAAICRDCGGITDFVQKDDAGHFSEIQSQTK